MTQIIQRSLSDDVLEKTMNLFWEKGYANTSVDDIVVVTGLNRAALYRYFGGKNKLFFAMLERFRDNNAAELIAPLQVKCSGIEGIKRFFLRFNEIYDSAELSSRGCFFVATASEIHLHSQDVSYFINLFVTELTSLFRSALSYSVTNGSVKADLNINATADFLVGSFFGLMTLCRSSAPRRVFENHVCGILDYLSTFDTK